MDEGESHAEENLSKRERTWRSLGEEARVDGLESLLEASAVEGCIEREFRPVLKKVGESGFHVVVLAMVMNVTIAFELQGRVSFTGHVGVD